MCTCAPVPFVQQLAAADAVFYGAVAELGAGVATFRVDRGWKGASGPTVQVSSVTPGCGLPFAEGERWLVYAVKGSDGALRTDACTRTTRSEAAIAADVASLGLPAGFAAPAAGSVDPLLLPARHDAVRATLGPRAGTGLPAGTLVDACAADFTGGGAEWAVTLLVPGAEPSSPRIERWILPASGPPVRLDWTSGPGFGVSDTVATVDHGFLFYGELRCLAPADVPAFREAFLPGFERTPAPAGRDSACFSFDHVYNNWQCFAADGGAFVRWGLQAVAD